MRFGADLLTKSGLGCVALGLAMFAGIAAAHAKPAYAGTWASSAPACQTAEPATLTERTYQEYEISCNFRRVVSGKNVWNITARCSGEGVSSIDHLTIWAKATRMTIKFARSTTRDNYVRCK